VEVALARIAYGWIFLRDDDDQIVIARCRFDGTNRGLATDFERPDMAGQLDFGAQWDDGVLAGSLGVFTHRGLQQST
jgi:hypothetical protein